MKLYDRHKHAGRRFQRKKWGDGEGDTDFVKKTRVLVHADVRGDVEHAASIMCLHFGLSKSSLINHAIAQLWQRVYPTIRSSDLAKYDQRIKEYALFRAYKEGRVKKKMKSITTATPNKEQIAEAKEAMTKDYQEYLQDPTRRGDKEE